MKITTYFLVLPLFFVLAFTASAQTSNRYGGSFAKGVQLFNTKDYDGAIDEFKKAEADNPANRMAYLWHGLAIMANGADLQHVNDAAAIYSDKLGAGDKYGAMAQYFVGLGYWRVGYVGNAKTWFGLAEMASGTPAATLAKSALKALTNNADAPPIENWATNAGLTENADSSVSPKIDETTRPTDSNLVDSQTNAVIADDSGTLSAERPILKCPVEQKPVKNGTTPDLELLKKVFRCQSGEKPAAKGMDGAFIIDVEAMQVGTSRKMDYLKDKGDGTPNVTVVYPIKITWTEKTFYRTRTAVVEKKIAVVNFNVNSFGEWQYGSATNISDGTYKSIARNQ